MQRKKSVQAILAIAASLTTSVCLAEVQGYVGFGLASNDWDVVDDSGTGVKFTGGVKFNDYIAVQVGYVDLGEASQGVSGVYELDVEGDGITLELVAYAPITEVVSLYVKGGVFNWDAKAEVSSPYYGSFEGEDDGNDPTYGIGASFNIDKAAAVSLGWQRYQDVSGTDIDSWSLDLNIYF